MPQDTLITPASRWPSLGLRELWSYRELAYFLAWRDVKVRYKQTLLGAAWAVLQPLLAMMIFTVFFGRLAKMPSDGVSYPVFAFAGLVPWLLFSSGVTHAGASTVESASLLRKVYFPRLVLPVGGIGASLVDFAIAMLVLFVMMAMQGYLPGARVLWLPAFTALAIAALLAVGIWVAALSVQFRDVRYVVPVALQLWMFATPVVYPTSLLPEAWRPWFGLNPMAGVVEGFRWSLVGSATAPGAMVAVSAAVTAVALVGGAFYFRHVERRFADIA